MHKQTSVRLKDVRERENVEIVEKRGGWALLGENVINRIALCCNLATFIIFESEVDPIILGQYRRWQWKRE
jgi:hypothetical protein